MALTIKSRRIGEVNDISGIREDLGNGIGIAVTLLANLQPRISGAARNVLTIEETHR